MRNTKATDRPPHLDFVGLYIMMNSSQIKAKDVNWLLKAEGYHKHIVSSSLLIKSLPPKVGYRRRLNVYLIHKEQDGWVGKGVF